jgi:hypothetical protein
LTIGGLSLAVVLMIAAVAFAGSLGRRVAHDSDSGRRPEVSGARHVNHPRVLGIKIRAAPEAKLDWGYDLSCRHRRHGAISGETAESREHHPPVVVKLQPTFRHPYDCTLKADATYDTRKHGRLVLNLYAKK